MLKSLSKPMQYALVVVLAIAAWAVLGPMLLPTARTVVRKPSTVKKISSKPGVIVYTDEDRKAHFDPISAPIKNAFVPLVKKMSGTGGAGSPNTGGVPNQFAGGEANWTYTGSVEVDGVLQALLENRSTGEGVFLRVGDTWKGVQVIQITEETLVLALPSGDQATLHLPTEDSVPTAAPTAGFAPATVNNPPLRGSIGQLNNLSVRPDRSAQVQNNGNQN